MDLLIAPQPFCNEMHMEIMVAFNKIMEEELAEETSFLAAPIDEVETILSRPEEETRNAKGNLTDVMSRIVAPTDRSETSQDCPEETRKILEEIPQMR